MHFRYESANVRSLGSDHVRALFEDRDGNLWIGAYQGGLNLLVNDRTGKSTPAFIRIKHDAGNPWSLRNDHVEAIYQDSEGNLWVGTYSGGLHRLSLGDLREFVALATDPISAQKAVAELTFTNLSHDPRDAGSLSDDYVEAIFQDHTGALWVGTSQGGLNRLVPGADKFVSHRNDANNPSSISFDNIECIQEDRSGNLWIGT